MKTERFRVAKWIFLAISILFNGFIVFYSCLPMEVTARWNASITNFISNIINNISKKDVEEIPLDNLKINFSDDQYNSIPGYHKNEIPLGSAKEIASIYGPETATNKSIVFSTQNPNIVKLNQKGDKVSVVGMEVDTTYVLATNEFSGLQDEIEVKVVKPIAPVNYEISASKTTIELGSYADIVFDIDGGPLGHNVLYNSRYYDIRELTYISSNPKVLFVDSLGVVHPLSEGTSSVSVSNGAISNEIEFTVVSGDAPSLYNDLRISGNNVTYENDFINNAHHSTLEIYDGDIKLSNLDFEWSSSNELLLNVDQTGTIRGFRKSLASDETAVITATSKITGQSVNYEVVVKEQLPTRLVYAVSVKTQTNWSPEIFTTCVGDSTKIEFYLEPSVYDNQMVVASSDTSIINPVFQGHYADLEIKATGTCTISFYYVRDPNLKGSVTFTVLNAGALNPDDIVSTGYTLRKVVGHAALFMVAQIPTIITVFMFLRKRALWIKTIISLSIGLFFAIVSETIELFVPQRSGTVIDVLIDFSGVVVGAMLFIVFFIIYKKRKNGKIVSSSKQDGQF